MALELKILTQKAEMLPVFPLFSQLNDSVSETGYAAMLDDMLAHGYRMLVVFEENEPVGLSGFWVMTKFYSGKYLELDNVVVAQSHRSAGIGKLICDFLENLARAEGVKTLMLDAYLENVKAHAFYEREGFSKRGFHFLKTIG